MNTKLTDSLTQFWNNIQTHLFSILEDIDLPLTPKLLEVVRVLELVEIERFLGHYRRGAVGRPCKHRIEMARAFVAKAVLNLPTTEALIDRLQVDIQLRRLCGFSSTHAVPDKSRFSRAFAEFAAMKLPELTHAAVIQDYLGDQLIGHISRDSSEIVAREKPRNKLAAAQEPKPKKKRGRPAKGTVVDKQEPIPTHIEHQQTQSLPEMIADLSTVCDTGTKLNSKGFKHSWNGYKIHIDTADGDIPVNAILTSASVHDSQVMMPLMLKTSAQLDYCYDVADAAYCSTILRDASRQLGHVPLIDHNPRRGEKIEFLPHEKQRYKTRSQSERVNAYLKDSHGGRQVWVRGHDKVMAHLMFGILVIASEQLLRLLT